MCRYFFDSRIFFILLVLLLLLLLLLLCNKLLEIANISFIKDIVKKLDVPISIDNRIFIFLLLLLIVPLASFYYSIHYWKWLTCHFRKDIADNLFIYCAAVLNNYYFKSNWRAQKPISVRYCSLKATYAKQMYILCVLRPLVECTVSHYNVIIRI